MAMRALIVAAFFVCLFTGARGTAVAITEYCPARVSVMHTVGKTDAPSPSQLFSYRLEGEGPRKISADVIIDTTRGWFAVRIPETTLSLYEQRWRSPSVLFRHKAYLSAPLYVRFAQPLTIVDAYVSNATASDDPDFDWNAKGNIECDPPAGFAVPVVSERVPSSPELLDAPDDSGAPIPSQHAVTQAVSIVAPGIDDCALPFSAVTVENPVQPGIPEALMDPPAKGGTAIVRVAVDAQGHVDDAWTFAPSGFDQFDDAVVRAAKHSTFKSGAAFCKAVPGFYFYRADFNRRYP